MWECRCGFANDDGSPSCVACGASAPARNESPGSLVLTNLRTKQRIEIARPGGIIGRAGNFCPDSFSPRVSRVHLLAEAHNGGNWTLEFVGRHKTELDAAGVWTPLEPNMPREVVGGEKLRMADMLFRIEVVPGNPVSSQSCAAANVAVSDACDALNGPIDDGPHPWDDEVSGSGREEDRFAPFEDAADAEREEPCANDEDYAYESAPEPDENDDTPQQVGWVVRCPVCGTAYPVEGPDARVDACAACFDPLDGVKISRCAPQPVYE